MMKTCEDCGLEYEGNECPFCKSERYWRELYHLVKELYGPVKDEEVLTELNKTAV